MDEYFVGIDPGKSGGVVILTGAGAIFEAWPMPELDELKLLSEWIVTNKAFVAIEDVQPDRGWQIKSAWTFAKHVGQLHLLFPKAKLVSPKTWQAKMTKGYPSKDPKERALMAASVRWKAMTWLATTRCKNPHDGMIDAALIAEYLRTNIVN
jgi:hypothetical protein